MNPLTEQSPVTHELAIELVLNIAGDNYQPSAKMTVPSGTRASVKVFENEPDRAWCYFVGFGKAGGIPTRHFFIL